MASSFTHSVPTLGNGQPNFSTCWYASYRMLLTFGKRNASAIEDKLNARKIDVADAKANGLEDKKYKDACDALGLKGWSGKSFNQEPAWYDFGLSDGAEAFIEELRKGPLWVSRVSGSNYHIVLAVGYDDGSEKIIFNNPFPGPADAVEQRLKANLFVRNITAASCSVQACR